MSVIEIKEYEFGGYNLIYDNNGWIIKELGEFFKTSLEAENYIKNGLKSTINVEFPRGTKERIEALNLNKSNSDFIRDVVLLKLNELEKILK